MPYHILACACICLASVAMATPLSVFRAAERFVAASMAMDPTCTESLTADQTSHVIEVISKLAFTTDQGTDGLEALAAVGSPFNLEQRQSISKVIRDITSGALVSASLQSRQVCKEQRHMHLFNYLPAKIWHVLEAPTETKQNKLRHLAHFMVDIIGCRNPSAPTKVLAVATVHAASRIESTPAECYGDVQDFSKIIKAKRGSIRGDQTLTVFPIEPADFIRRHPCAYPESDPPAACPFCVNEIIDRTRRDVMPARCNNAALARSRRGTHPLGVHRSPTSDNVGGHDSFASIMVTALQHFITNGTGAPRSAEDIPGLRVYHTRNSGVSGASPAALGDDQSNGIIARGSSAGFAPGGTGDSADMPGCFSPRAALTGNIGSLQASVAASVQSSMAKRACDAAAVELRVAADAASVGPSVAPACPLILSVAERFTARKTRKLKKSTGRGTKALPRRRPTPLCLGDAAPPFPVPEPWVPSAEACAPPASAHKAPARMKRPAAALAIDRAEPNVADVVAAKLSIFKFPAVVEYLRATPVAADRPRPQPKPTAYSGGKIYYSAPRRALRVYARVADTYAQNIPIDFANKDTSMTQWNLACAYIEADTRP